MRKELHVVFGAGQVGPLVAARLLAADKRVRLVKRSADIVPAGVELMLGDAGDAQFCTAACAGASAVYHCMNPPYVAKVWAELLPRYMENLIAATGRAGGRLVALDNLYMLGRTNGRPMDEDTPSNPCSRKGEIRARVAERLLAAHAKGEVRAVTGRASDFYGPRGTQTYVGDYYWKPVIAGKKVWSPVDPDARHTYHYIPDVARGLATLGTANDEVLGRVWMLPCQEAESMRVLSARFAQHMGREIRVGAIPKSIVTSLGWFMPLIHEMTEMLYQWDEPFVVDDRRFRERFSWLPTEREEAAKITVDWATRHYARA